MNLGHTLEKEKLVQKLDSEQDDGLLRKWKKRSWSKNWIQSKMTDCYENGKREVGPKIGFRTSEDGVHNKLTSHSIESVGQALSVRSGQKTRTNHVWGRHGTVRDSGAAKASSDTDVTETRKPEYSTRRLASLLCGTRVDVCLCPKIQKANS